MKSVVYRYVLILVQTYERYKKNLYEIFFHENCEFIPFDRLISKGTFSSKFYVIIKKLDFTTIFTPIHV